jgi:hypothetical protein
MAGLTTLAETNILNWMKGTTWPSSAGWGAAPVTTYVGLFTTAPTTDASATYTGTEVSGSSYARVAVTSSSGWSAITGGSTTPAQISNAGIITFPTPTGSWGTILAVGIFDASTTGNLLWWATITSQAIASGVVASFAIAALVLTMD